MVTTNMPERGARIEFAAETMMGTSLPNTDCAVKRVTTASRRRWLRPRSPRYVSPIGAPRVLPADDDPSRREARRTSQEQV
jgi:hypothetical protein